jgi:hypothetical protein
MDHGPDQVAQGAYDAGQRLEEAQLGEDTQAIEPDSWGGAAAEQVAIGPDLLNSSEPADFAEEAAVKVGDNPADRTAYTNPVKSRRQQSG